ncbi:MAG: glycoside hydrolase family 88 protein [Rhizobiales bacterium]|nr:glycoside hydrolase family 88 protein [Hyphomicrobiales bacterium]
MHTDRQRQSESASQAVLTRVAERTRRFNFGVWFWGDAIAFDGLIDAADLLDEPTLAEFCVSYFDRWHKRPPAWTDYLTPGLALARLVQCGADTLLPSMRRLLDCYLFETPRGETGLHYFRPDMPQFRTTVLVDSLYHVPPFIAACAEPFRDPSLYREAIVMWNEHAKVLSLPGKPLLCHNYDHGSGRRRGYGWGRGNGWALLGLIDLIELLPSAAEDRDSVVEEFCRLSSAVLAEQDASGFWRTLLDDRESYLETSTAGFFGAVFTKGARLGLLHAEYADAAELAWRALLTRIDQDGGVFGTSAATWAANAPVEELALYKAASTEVNVWGQGAALRFASERLRAGIH